MTTKNQRQLDLHLEKVSFWFKVFFLALGFWILSTPILLMDPATVDGLYRLSAKLLLIVSFFTMLMAAMKNSEHKHKAAFFKHAFSRETAS